MKFIQKISNTLKTYYFNMLFLFLPLDFLCIRYFIIISRKLRLIVEPFITFLFITFSYLYIKHSFITKICNEESNIFKKIINKIKQLPIYQFIIPILALLPLTTNLILWFYIICICLYSIQYFVCSIIIEPLFTFTILFIIFYKNTSAINAIKSFWNNTVKRFSFNIFVWSLLFDIVCLFEIYKHTNYSLVISPMYLFLKILIIPIMYIIENKQSKFIKNDFIINNGIYTIFAIISFIFSILTTISLLIIMYMHQDIFIIKIFFLILKPIYFIFKTLFTIIYYLFVMTIPFSLYITTPLY